MRMLSAFKPPRAKDITRPVVVVSTHTDPASKVEVSEVNFVYSRTVEDALYQLLSVEAGPHISGWIKIKEHPSVQAALAYGSEVAKAFQFKELADTKGYDLYNTLYGLFCPKHMKV